MLILILRTEPTLSFNGLFIDLSYFVADAYQPFQIASMEEIARDTSYFQITSFSMCEITDYYSPRIYLKYIISKPGDD